MRDATKLLRPGLLEGVAVLVAGAPTADRGAAWGPAVQESCTELGAQVATCVPDGAQETALEQAVAAAARAMDGLDLLAVDGAALFAAGLARGGNGHAALRACADGAWNVTRAVVGHALLSGQTQAEGSAPAPRPPRIVYLAPVGTAGEYAEAACASLENLARTLSIEWARYGVTAVAIAPGARTSAGEVAALAAYLAAPAGAYFSGCLLDLRGP
jgi:NAD(P)-dependent dehydrogenase (short-subunit alcohol dehydrogenase family)